MVNPMGTVLVGGGTGFIGRYLTRALKNKNYDVTVISRMPGPQRVSWNDIQKIGLPQGVKAVVNLAGQNVLDPTQRWSAGFRQNVFNSRVNTTASLTNAICQSSDPPDVFVSISGVGIYKPDQCKEYSEETRLEDFEDFFYDLCREWEKSAKLPAHVNTRQVTIRSGVVLGRYGGMIKQLYWPFFLGLGGPVGNGEQFLPWIHIGDLCGLILYAIENKKIKGVLNGVAPQPITNKEFSDAFAKALGRPAVIPLPEIFLKLLLSEERANMLTKGQKVIPKRAPAFGYKYVFPTIGEACKELTNSPKI